MRFARDRLGPGLLDERHLRLAPDQLFGCVAVDAGDVRGREVGQHRQRRQWRGDIRFWRLSRPKNNFLAETGLDNSRLVCQFAIERLKARVAQVKGLYAIFRIALQPNWNTLVRLV